MIAKMLYNFEVLTMKAVTYSWARNNLAQTIDSVCDNHEAMIITKKND
jgi:antitoxin YefM